MVSSKKGKKVTPPQLTEVKEKKPKVVMRDEYKNLNTFENDFITDKMMIKLGKELVDWAKANDDAIKIKQFLADKGISEKKWHDWYTKYDDLREAHDQAKMIIGNRREHGLVTRKYADGPTSFMMPHYDKDWRDEQEHKANLNKKDGEMGGATKIVVMENYGKQVEDEGKV